MRLKIWGYRGREKKKRPPLIKCMTKTPLSTVSEHVHAHAHAGETETFLTQKQKFLASRDAGASGLLEKHFKLAANFLAMV